MDLGGTHIITPYERPVGFDPDWRSRVAAVIFDTPNVLLPAQLRSDPYIIRQVNFLRINETDSNAFVYMTGDVPIYRQALDIYTGGDYNNIADYLDALLLTEVDLSIIAKDVGYSEDVVRYYERMYFACRDDNGMPLRSELAKTLFAVGTAHTLDGKTPIPVLWRAIGASLGYTALVTGWRWQNPAGPLKDQIEMYELLSRIGLSRLNTLAVTGRLEAIDINQFLGQSIRYVKTKHEMSESGVQDDGMEILIKLLRMLAPKMDDAAMSGRALEAYELGSTALVEADAAINAIDISEDGLSDPGMSLDDRLKETMKPLAQQYQELDND